MRAFLYILGLGAVSFAGCNVSPTVSRSTGGVDAMVDAGAACDHGEVVLLTDFTSTQIALSGPDGNTLSPAFLSTASTKTSGLAFALSGDVALPGATPPSGRVVLIDRYGTNVITWADPTTAHVYAQLPVGTGFESNPQDYLELDDSRAYVSRYGVNAAPGNQPFDSGSDVLLIDSRAPSILKSIPMPVEENLPPRPAGMTNVSGTTLVVLQRISEDFATVGESAVVGISNDAVAWETHVSGLKNCGRPALSPSGRTLAIACGGQLAMDGSVMDLSAAAVDVYDATSLPPTPVHRFPISDQLGAAPQQDGIAFASETLLVGKTQTALGGATDNQAFSLDITTGKATVLLTASKDAQGKGKGVVYGDFRCSPGCANVCLLADADTGKLRRFALQGNNLMPLSDITVETMTGLPPRLLGGY